MSQNPPPKTQETYPLAFLTGTGIGLVLGGLLALWYAPRSGQQTRAWLGGQVRQTQQKIQGESIEQALAEGRALAHQYRAQRADSTPS